MAKLAHLFLDCDLRCNHVGLLALLKKEKITMTQDDFVIFVNAKKTHLKMLCKSETALLHYKAINQPIDMNVIRYLPKYCDGKTLDMDGALREHLETVFKKKGIRLKKEEEPIMKKVKTITRKRALIKPKELFEEQE